MKSTRSIYHFFIALAGVFILSACSEQGDFAKFSFQDNLAVSYNSEAKVTIETLVNDVQLLELKINDSVVQQWKNPNKGTLTFILKANDFGIGAKTMVLEAVNSDGELFKDERILRVLSDLVPEKWTFDIVNTYPHNTANFTQGLEFDGNQLIESTGQYGQSKIAKIDLHTGNDLLKIGLDQTHFGEGITILGDTIYQLTWTTKKCFLYDKNTLQILSKDFTYQGEGWGICNDGTSIITSDGSERLIFRDPKTFAVQKTIEVYTDSQPVIRLNELEYINGLIYANVWMSNAIVVIEPETGRVLATLDGSNLVTLGRGNTGEVLNGIAYNKAQDAIYVTGKNWAKLFQLKLHKAGAEAIVQK